MKILNDLNGFDEIIFYDLTAHFNFYQYFALIII